MHVISSKISILLKQKFQFEKLQYLEQSLSYTAENHL